MCNQDSKSFDSSMARFSNELPNNVVDLLNVLQPVLPNSKVPPHLKSNCSKYHFYLAVMCKIKNGGKIFELCLKFRVFWCWRTWNQSKTQLCTGQNFWKVFRNYSNIGRFVWLEIELILGWSLSWFFLWEPISRSIGVEM